jgi:hypothetical protein
LRRAAEETVEGFWSTWMLCLVGEFDVDFDAIFWVYISSCLVVSFNKSFSDPLKTSIISHILPQSAIRLFVVLS